MPKAPWNVGSRIRFKINSKTHLELPWETFAAKAIWKNSSKRRVLGQAAWALHPVLHHLWMQSLLTDTKCSQISRILMASAVMDEKCSPGDLNNYFLIKLLKIRYRVKPCTLTLTSRAICTPENPLFFSFSGILCIIYPCYLTFEANRWGYF